MRLYRHLYWCGKSFSFPIISFLLYKVPTQVIWHWYGVVKVQYPLISKDVMGRLWLTAFDFPVTYSYTRCPVTAVRPKGCTSQWRHEQDSDPQPWVRQSSLLTVWQVRSQSDFCIILNICTQLYNLKWCRLRSQHLNILCLQNRSPTLTFL